MKDKDIIIKRYNVPATRIQHALINIAIMAIITEVNLHGQNNKVHRNKSDTGAHNHSDFESY